MRTSINVSSGQRLLREPRAHRCRGAVHGKRIWGLASLVAAGLLLAPQALAADPSRAMQGSCSTTFAFTSTGAIQIDGVCQYAHLGRTTVSALQIVIPQPDGSDFITNTSVYTAANGDQLFTNTVGTGHLTSPTTIEFSGTETYVGGTGRFLNATGSSDLTGGAEFVNSTGHYTVTGHIAY